MKTVGDLLTRAHAELGELEKAMRVAVVNQNISDILAAARARLAQAAAHPDAGTELDKIQDGPDTRMDG